MAFCVRDTQGHCFWGRGHFLLLSADLDSIQSPYQQIPGSLGLATPWYKKSQIAGELWVSAVPGGLTHSTSEDHVWIRHKRNRSTSPLRSCPGVSAYWMEQQDGYSHYLRKVFLRVSTEAA